MLGNYEVALEDDDTLSEEEIASDGEENQSDVTFDQSEAGEESSEVKGVETLPLASLKENMERGKAARKQMSKKNQLFCPS